MTATQPQTEKPYHYTYLKEFRVNQCPLFLQHKCTQHRPFTCFNWHFANQRRRRPVRKRDGTFNYSADVYCSKYDETTGICPNGDDCVYLHRNTGDTERRYHLRYYKTGTCIHETDSRGNCVKNGPHCAFAHGAQDLRPPVYDIREVEQKSETVHREPLEQVNLSEKIVNEDPKWQDANYVLSNYKTDQCRRPPRLCRQGYACPQYHNPKDRRRNPKKHKYRSSPCPNVKQGDDWKDPSCCEKGDSCQFCHTRTEQQFHPEIYKSTKCHDVMQNGYCPRGPFCAFAHVQQEIRVVEDPPEEAPTSPVHGSLPFSQDRGFGDGGMLSSSAPGAGRPSAITLGSPYNPMFEQENKMKLNMWNDNITSQNIGNERTPQSSSSLYQSHDGVSLFEQNNSLNNAFPSCPSPIAKPNWLSPSLGKMDAHYGRAPGSGRNELSQSMGSGLASSPFSWGSVPVTSNFMGVNSLSSTESSPNSLNKLKSLNHEAKPFYPPFETVDSVVGSALEDFEVNSDLNFDKVQAASRFWPEPIGSGRDSKNDSSFFTMSAPVNIPHDSGPNLALRAPQQRNPLHTPSPPSGTHSLLYGSLEIMGGMHRGSYSGTSMPSIGRPPSSSGMTGYNAGKGSNPGSLVGSCAGTDGTLAELERMQKKCRQWEECWNQAKTACDAWKKEATEANERAKRAEESLRKDHEQALIQEEELQKSYMDISNLASQLQNQNHGSSMNSDSYNCGFLHRSQRVSLLKQIPVKELKELRNRLKTDLDSVDKVLWEAHGEHCEEGWVKK